MPQAPETLLDYQFAELPKDYRPQRRRIIAWGMQHGGRLTMSEITLLGSHQSGCTTRWVTTRRGGAGRGRGVNGGGSVLPIRPARQVRFQAGDRHPCSPRADRRVAVGIGDPGLRSPSPNSSSRDFIFPAWSRSSARRRACATAPGAALCPIVTARPGAGHPLEHHSESVGHCLPISRGCGWVIPSSPRRAYGLLLSAIRDPDPVMFFEPDRTSIAP